MNQDTHGGLKDFQDQASGKGARLDNIYDAGRMIQEYQAYIRDLEKINFKTGVTQIDNLIRGVAGGEVLTIIARAAAFKTAILQNMLMNYIQTSPWGAIFFSLEMPVAAVTERYHEMISGFTGAQIESAYRNKEAYLGRLQGNFIKALDRLYMVQVKVGLREITEYVNLIGAHYGVKVGIVGIDYLGLLDERGPNQYEIISRLARDVKTLAKELSLPVILLTQASRKAGSGDTKITLDMGRDSGAIEEAADFVIGLFQEERESKGAEPEYDLIATILKNRKGPRNSMWKLDINPQILRLESEAEAWKPPRGNNKKNDL